MIQIEREWFRKAKSGEVTLDQLAEYLLKNFPVYEIARSLAETIEYNEPKPIVISQEEFSQHFRIRGVRADGELELRGRPKSDTTP